VVLFADASYWISLFCQNEENYPRAIELKAELSHETICVNEHAFGEVFTFLARRHGGQVAFEKTSAILSNPRIEVVQAGQGEWREALELGRKYGFSFTDCLTALQMRRTGVREIVSFDSDFDKFPWIDRIS